MSVHTIIAEKSSLGALETSGIVVMMIDKVVKMVKGKVVIMKGTWCRRLYYLHGRVAIERIPSKLLTKDNGEADITLTGI